MQSYIEGLLNSGSTFVVDLLIVGLEGGGKPVWVTNRGVYSVDGVGIVVEAGPLIAQNFDVVGYAWANVAMVRVTISEDKRK